MKSFARCVELEGRYAKRHHLISGTGPLSKWKTPLRVVSKQLGILGC